MKSDAELDGRRNTRITSSRSAESPHAGARDAHRPVAETMDRHIAADGEGAARRRRTPVRSLRAGLLIGSAVVHVFLVLAVGGSRIIPVGIARFAQRLVGRQRFSCGLGISGFRVSSSSSRWSSRPTRWSSRCMAFSDLRVSSWMWPGASPFKHCLPAPTLGTRDSETGGVESLL